MAKPFNLFVQIRIYLWMLYLVLPGSLLFGCSSSPPEDAGSDNAARDEQKLPAVEVKTASRGSLTSDVRYVGTTFPVREISLRSRVEGQILDLNVDVGDRVEPGQVLGRIDNSISQATVLEARSELAALESEVVSLQADINQAQTEVEQAKIELEQARSDLTRSQQLVKDGAITQQAAEQSQNAVDTARQALTASQQQVANRTSALAAAQQRVAAQSALLTQEQQRESFSQLTSPIAGLVLERVLEPGNLAQVGDEVLQLGDFSQVEVRVEVSELELAKISVGQPAKVRLDAFPQQDILGKVTRISLAADPTARLIPIEVTIPNSDAKIGRGLLARVSFEPETANKIVIPETALEVTADRAAEVSTDSNRATIFVLQSAGENSSVVAREVELGDRANGRVEILAGLEPGEQFVVRSSDSLNSGDRIRLSFLSEPSPASES